MKISNITTPNRHQEKVSRYKDFHEIQLENHEEFSKEVKKNIAFNSIKEREFKIQQEINHEKKELYQLPYHKAVMLKKLRIF